MKFQNMKFASFLIGLLVITGLTVSVSKAQTYPNKPKVNDVLYMVDIKDNTKVYTMTVLSEKKMADNFADESFVVERKRLKAKATAKKSKKKKFGQLLKEAAGGAVERDTKQKETLALEEGKYEYKMTEDNTANTDDDVMMKGQYKLTIQYSTPFRHGFFYEIGGGFYKEVFFSYESHNKLYREEPEKMHTIFVVGKDKDATIAKAKTMNFEEEKKKYYTPDPKSGRFPHGAVDATDYTFGTELHSLRGEYTLPPTMDFLYLPTKTIEGRNLMYNRGILQVELYKGDELIGTKNLSKGHKKGKWVEKVVNSMDVPYRSFGKLKAGKYQLRFSILGNEPFFLSDFEVYTVPNPDINAEDPNFYIMKGDNDNYLAINPGRTIEDAVRYSIGVSRFFKMKPQKKDEVKGVKVVLLKDGQKFGQMDRYDDSNTKTLNIDLMYGDGRPALDTELDLKFIGKGDDYYNREDMPDGSYKVEYYIKDKLFASASFKIKDNEIVLEGNSNRETADLKKFLVSKDGYVFIPLKYHN